VSLMTGKRKSNPHADVAQRARDAAAQVAPAAKNAVPAAKNAGLAAKHSAEDAMAWAAPLVRDARAWAAPHVEQAGMAVRDKIAPSVSSALFEAAHRIDNPAPRRRRWPRVLAGVAMAAAAASALAAVLQRRLSAMESVAMGDATDRGTADDSAADDSATSPYSPGLPERSPAEDDREPGGNGQMRTS
jgi:hypothetical protein